MILWQQLVRLFQINSAKEIDGYRSPYGDGNTAARIVDIIKTVDLSDEKMIKKVFYDIDYEEPSYE